MHAPVVDGPVVPRLKVLAVQHRAVLAQAHVAALPHSRLALVSSMTERKAEVSATPAAVPRVLGVHNHNTLKLRTMNPISAPPSRTNVYQGEDSGGSCHDVIAAVIRVLGF